MSGESSIEHQRREKEGSIGGGVDEREIVKRMDKKRLGGKVKNDTLCLYFVE